MCDGRLDVLVLGGGDSDGKDVPLLLALLLIDAEGGGEDVDDADCVAVESGLVDAEGEGDAEGCFKIIAVEPATGFEGSPTRVHTCARL